MPIFVLSITFTIVFGLLVFREGGPWKEQQQLFSNKYCRNANRRQFPRLHNLYPQSKPHSERNSNLLGLYLDYARQISEKER